MKQSTKFTLSLLMKQAWTMVKRYGMSMSAAMKQAWKIAMLRKAMKSGIVRFLYKKVSGEIREAIGTLKFQFGDGYEQNKSETKNFASAPYMDTEKNAWRSFNVANLIGML